MKTVLLLEDEVLLAKMYAKKLRSGGHRVLVAQTAEEALDEGEKETIDVAVVDHGIKDHEVSGLDVLPKLRAMLPDARILMLSNYSRAQLEESSLSQGADDFLLKIDTSPDTLLRYVDATDSQS